MTDRPPPTAWLARLALVSFLLLVVGTRRAWADDEPAQPRLELPADGRLPLPAPPALPSALDPSTDDALWFQDDERQPLVQARFLLRSDGGFLLHKGGLGLASGLAVGRQWWTTHRKVNPIGEVSLGGDLGFGAARGSRGAELRAVAGAASKRLMLRAGGVLLTERTRFSETQLAAVWAVAPLTALTLSAGDIKLYALAAPRLFLSGDRRGHPTFPVFDEPVFGGGLSVYGVGVRWTGRWTSAGSFHLISLVLGGA